MAVSAFSQLSSVSKLVTTIQCASGTSVSTSCGILGESGGIIRYQPTNVSAAKWRLFRVRTNTLYPCRGQKSPTLQAHRYALSHSWHSSLVLDLAISSILHS